ncbi:hypothetical protein EON63_05605 [archaeon]|nr:MAG: hypothetical protein EON63_05605 [archaeon]
MMERGTNQTNTYCLMHQVTHQFLALFAKHFAQANQRVVDFVLSISLHDITIIITYATTTCTLIALAAYLLSTLDKRPRHDYIVTLLGFIMVILLVLPIMLPYKALILGGGLQNFNFVLYIFGRFMEIMRHDCRANTHHIEQHSSSINQAVNIQASSKHQSTLSTHSLSHHKGGAMYNLYSMLSCYIYPHVIPNDHKHKHTRTHTHSSPPSMRALLAELVWLLVLFDATLYVIQEVLPNAYTNDSSNPARSNITFLPSFHPASPSTVHFYTGLWSCAFDMICMSLVYILAQCICVCMFAHHIPIHMLHATPALAHSVSEFWKVRWNPCTSKLLQYALYKPTISYLHTHYAHLPKVYVQILTVCVVFFGSGVLHAYPIYIATGSVYDALCMGGFFVTQIVFILAENIVQKVTMGRHTHTPLPHPSSSPTSPIRSDTSLVRSKAAEYFVIASMLYVIHIVHDGIFTPIHISILTVVVTTNLYVMYTLYEHQINPIPTHRSLSPPSSPSSSPLSRPRSKSITVLYYVCGWLYTISTMAYLIPLFSIPMHHALGHVYARSYVVGPLVRTVMEMWQMQ